MSSADLRLVQHNVFYVRLSVATTFITYAMAISHQLLACHVGNIQLTFSMSGNFQLLSRMAFSGP
jgi:hypothetical protein